MKTCFNFAKRDSWEPCGTCESCRRRADANARAEKFKRALPFPNEEPFYMQTYLIDIDGTISDCAWRQSHAEAKDYDTFHALCGEDKPIENVCRLVRNLATEHCVILVTGRSENNRRATELWCTRHDLRVDDILMRPEKDYRPADELKVALVTDYFGGIDKALAAVTLVIDDHEKVTETFRNLGFCVLQASNTAMAAGA